jgi:hypothetical protein
MHPDGDFAVGDRHYDGAVGPRRLDAEGKRPSDRIGIYESLELAIVLSRFVGFGESFR